MVRLILTFALVIGLAACSLENDLETLTKVGADSGKVKAFASTHLTNDNALWYGLPVTKASFRVTPNGVVAAYIEFPDQVGFASIAQALKDNRDLRAFQRGQHFDANGIVDGHSFELETSRSKGATQLVIYDDVSFKAASFKYKGYVERWANNECFKKGEGWQTCTDKEDWLTVSRGG